MTKLSLVPVGLPRPQRDGLPLPYIAGNGCHLDIELLAPCVIGGLCQVCGLPVSFDDGVVFVDRMAGVRSDGVWVGSMVLDSAGLHRVCARMAERLCPHLRGEDRVVVVPIVEAGWVCLWQPAESARSVSCAALAVAPFDDAVVHFGG